MGVVRAWSVFVKACVHSRGRVGPPRIGIKWAFWPDPHPKIKVKLIYKVRHTQTVRLWQEIKYRCHIITNTHTHTLFFPVEFWLFPIAITITSHAQWSRHCTQRKIFFPLPKPAAMNFQTWCKRKNYNTIKYFYRPFSLSKAPTTIGVINNKEEEEKKLR